MLLRSVCTSMGSGVVKREGITSSPIIEQTVPIMPALCPAASRTDLMRKLAVVLPLVPVMPMSFRRRAGLPKNSCAM